MKTLKFIGYMLCLMLVFSFAACEDENETPTEDQGSEETSEPDTGSQIHIYYDKNGATSGEVPLDESEYTSSSSPAALGNPLGLIKIADDRAYAFKEWNTTADGTGVAYNKGDTIALAEEDITLYAQWRDTELEVGDIGPAGGYIFYKKSQYTNGWKYLECAPVETEWTDIEWGPTDLQCGVSESSLGEGKDNTSTIIETFTAQGNISGTAAQLCDNLECGGYDDWFLPTTSSLLKIEDNLVDNDLGSFTATNYWGSNESDTDEAWRRTINTGSQYAVKSSTYKVRAVRSF